VAVNFMHDPALLKSFARSSVLVLGLLAAGAIAVVRDKTDEAALSAGTFTVERFDKAAYSEPAPVLNNKQRQFFMVGRNIFHRQWASINSLNGDWGLGPTFIADRCSACHVNAGRGGPPASRDEQMLSMLVRLSLPGEDKHGAPRAHPHYGDQLQNRSLDGRNVDFAYAGSPVPPEADLYMDWEERIVRFPDGEVVELRAPMLRIENLNFGPLGADAMTSVRIAQPIFGLGFLEAVSEQTLADIAREQKALGFSGRPNYVWDAVNKRRALGRFGWKANQPSLKQQIATAAIGDMGLSSRLFPDQNCPRAQEICARHLPGNVPEIINHEIEALELWLQGLAVPARRSINDPEVRLGEKLFAAAKCAVCHVPEMKTAAMFPPLPQLANQTFRAYTDLLLHDMGEELADGRPDFKAGPRDWRTAPLWGLGLSQTVNGSTAMLHDGRARNVVEAILWHGGEAEVSREAYRNMSKADREALVRFIEAI
jgi:CxxC motif-containing protein (DUF1111 family)